MGYRYFGKELLETFLDFIYPRNINCIICDEDIDKTEAYSMCAICRDTVKFITSRYCEKCGKPLEPLYLPQQCPDCITTKHYFDRGFSCVEYDDTIKKLIYDLKYYKKRYLAYPMAQVMAERLNQHALGKIDMIVPVPLHRKKEAERGFNQSLLIAKYIGDLLRVPVNHKGIVRKKETISLNKLTKDERRENLKDAFQLMDKEIFRHKKILLVDDIYTTGSTIDACSKELRKGNPKEIFFITFATGKNT